MRVLLTSEHLHRTTLEEIDLHHVQSSNSFHHGEVATGCNDASAVLYKWTKKSRARKSLFLLILLACVLRSLFCLSSATHFASLLSDLKHMAKRVRPVKTSEYD